MFTATFRNRRRISICVTSVALFTVACIAIAQKNRLAHPTDLTGAIVLASILLLALLGLRRRLPAIPLGNASTWTQVHLYLGIFSAGVYMMHVPTLIGHGIFECGLSIVFLSVTASGFYGIYVSRTLPKRLTAIEAGQRPGTVAPHHGPIAETPHSIHVRLRLWIVVHGIFSVALVVGGIVHAVMMR